MTDNDCAVLVFSKAPVPGTVKTRLIPELNETGAARLYEELAYRTLSKVTGQRPWDVQLWCTPVMDHPFFQDCSDRYKVGLHLQSGRDLGERMYSAAAAALTRYRSVILIGCDCPELDQSDLDSAKIRLDDGYDAVLGPCEDGGYYLIGLRASHKKIFNSIEWGSRAVMEDTRNRLRTLELDWYELPLRWDLDDMEDLGRYMKVRGEG